MHLKHYVTSAGTARMSHRGSPRRTEVSLCGLLCLSSVAIGSFRSGRHLTGFCLLGDDIRRKNPEVISAPEGGAQFHKSRKKSRARTMGPATSCGKKQI